MEDLEGFEKIKTRLLLLPEGAKGILFVRHHEMRELFKWLRPLKSMFEGYKSKPDIRIIPCHDPDNIKFSDHNEI